MQPPLSLAWLRDKQTQQLLKTVIEPVAGMVYQEVYVYLWILCVYNLLLFLFVVATFFLLLRSRTGAGDKKIGPEDIP